MKILYIGMLNSSHTVKWVNAFSDRGHEVMVATLSGQTDLRQEIRSDIHVAELPKSGFKGYYLNGPALRKLYREFRPDVSNAHYASGYGTLARVAGIPNLILSVWGSDVYEFPYQSRIKEIILKKNLAYASHICSTSHCMADQVEKIMGHSMDITITPFGVANREIKWIVLAVVMFIASGVTQTYDFSKSPMVFHLFVFMLMIIYFRKGIKNIVMVAFGGAMGAILVVMYKATGFSTGLDSLYNGIFGRILFTQFGVLSYHLEYFGKIGNFLYGRSLSPTILSLLGQDPSTHVRSGKIIMGFYGHRSVYDGTAGVMNTNFIGEAYANFGWAGLVFSIVWVGLVISLLFFMIIKIKKTPATIAFLAVMTKSIGAMTQGGFADFIYSFSIIVTIVGFLIIIYFSDITVLFTKKRKKATIAAASAGVTGGEIAETIVHEENASEESQRVSEDDTRNNV